jgi:hypothetical protein
MFARAMLLLRPMDSDLRFWNDDILRNIDELCAEVLMMLGNAEIMKRTPALATSKDLAANRA